MDTTPLLARLIPLLQLGLAIGATRATPIADSVTMKLVWGVSQGLLTTIAGSV